MAKIKVYVADTSPLKKTAFFEKSMALLTDAEQIRILQKKHTDEKCNALGGALLLRYALNEMEIFNFEVIRDGHKKPCLAGDGMPFFNLSHSKERVMCAVSDCAVGCDVQWMDPNISPTVAKRFFTARECAALQACATEEERRCLFYRIWTLKESFVKMTGEGVIRAFHTFSVLPGCDGGFCFSSDFATEVPCFFEPCTEVNYRYALCAERGLSVSTQRMDLASFL